MLPEAPITTLSDLISAELDAEDVTAICVNMALPSLLATLWPSPLNVTMVPLPAPGVSTVFLAPSSAVHL